MKEHNPYEVRGIPWWLTALLVLAFIGGGVWLVGWVWKSSEKSSPGVIAMEPAKATTRSLGSRWPSRFGTKRGGPSLPPEQPDGVRTNAEGWIVAKAGNLRVSASTQPSGRWSINAHYSRGPGWYTPEQWELSTIRLRILRDEAMAKALEVTPQQIARLESLSAGAGMVLSSDERQGLEQLLSAYRSAPERAERAEAEKSLLSALVQAGERNLARTQEDSRQRVMKVKDILTAEQIEKFRGMGR